ncbi:hypothetical protein RFI_06614 [Reticulomyxa filosa]|uniref:Uncharacterized protein n=1 Tax=Reticulomyxa filosa TaxID=46433 RepID=X6NW29_RETFI|nr:hypothetical protein RFI_06614 [Reticulomyxa filosa]|eukprot:ETO30505.1 hypothetical protein RFI_06614 [Reticulomyxa filosa]
MLFLLALKTLTCVGVHLKAAFGNSIILNTLIFIVKLIIFFFLCMRVPLGRYVCKKKNEKGGHENDCRNAVFESTNVALTNVRCGNTHEWNGTGCSNTLFKNNENSGFYLTCVGGDTSCKDMSIEYDGGKQYDTYCSIECNLDSAAQTDPTCKNINITIANNDRGFDAITICVRSAR